jgi:hypothetical protein
MTRPINALLAEIKYTDTVSYSDSDMDRELILFLTVTQMFYSKPHLGGSRAVS